MLKTSLATVVGIGIYVVVKINRLQDELKRERKLRAEERAGRTKAEKELRTRSLQHQNDNGYTFRPIGTVNSCFRDRRGTPRQGNLVPDGRASIILNSSTVPPASVESLDEYSHVWVIFLFHENTNALKMQQQATVKAKIAPPRLGGKKVGLFSTRTPHRPNSIGLSVVKLDAVGSGRIEISGHDFVDGTPVLDIKPYVPNDVVDDFICPTWVQEPNNIPTRRIEFTRDVKESLAFAVESKRLMFYSSYDQLCQAISQVLTLDIRSVYQKRGETSMEEYICRFDSLKIIFVTLQDCIRVIRVEY